MTDSRRKVTVFASLVGVLTLTSALLLALAPAPLTADASSSLFAVDSPDSLDVIFNTAAPAVPGRWNYIYIHHSRTPAGSALTLGRLDSGLGDHFLIGNGDGMVDGEIQIGQLWNQQESALPPAGADQIDPRCISICLVGDFDRGMPTQTQLRRLAQLVGALQDRFQIPAQSVLVIEEPASAAGIGQHFPLANFRQTLLP